MRNVRWSGRVRRSVALIVVCVTAGAVAASGLSASNSTSAAPKKPLAGKKVVLAVYWLDSYGSALAAWTKKAVEAEGGKLQVINPNADAIKQANALRDALQQHVAGIMWQPIQTNTAGPLVKQIQAAHIPLVLFGGYQDPKVIGTTMPQVIIDDYKATYKMGRDAANYITTNFPGQVPSVVAFNDATDSLVVTRVQGFLAGLKSVRSDTQVVFGDNVTTGVTTAQAKMQDIITATPKFNVVLGTGGDTAAGMMAALQAAGRGKAVNKKASTEWIGLIDGTPQELQELFDPNQSVEEVLTVTPKENAYLNVATLTKIITGKLKPKANVSVQAAGTVLPPNCAQAVAIFKSEYGIVKSYTAPTCP